MGRVYGRNGRGEDDKGTMSEEGRGIRVEGVHGNEHTGQGPILRLFLEGVYQYIEIFIRLSMVREERID